MIRCALRVSLAALVFTTTLSLVACRRSEPSSSAVGTLEMLEVDVGPLQPSRAVRITAHEGDVVHTGDTLAVFALPTSAAAEVQAAARVDAARESARELDRGARPAELARAEATLRAASVEAERYAGDLARIEPLATKGVVSQAALDAARATARVSAERRDEARQSLLLLREGPRIERRRAANADARAAAAGADVIRAAASDLVLLSPMEGVVTSRNAEPGEVLAAGQSALTLAAPGKPWARIYVSQFVLPTLHVGDTLTARLDGDSTVYRGRIVAIASRAEYTPRVALTDEERADLLFGVKLEFDNRTDRLKAGLPITVRLPLARR